MADTLPNITLAAGVWTDLYAAAGIPPGSQVFVENVGAFDVRISSQAAQPPPDHDSYQVVQREGGLLAGTAPGSNGLWAFCPNTEGKVNVRRSLLSGGSAVPPALPLTAFGEVSVAESTPVVQVTSAYGLTGKVVLFNLNGGTAGVAEGMFESATGVDPNGQGGVLSARQLAYRAGQGIIARWTAVFDAPVVDNMQQAGLVSNTDRLVFGYNAAAVFGISRIHSGESETQELTFTVASGNEDATITVDGTAHTVPLTNGTVEHNAFEAAMSLDSQIPAYDFTSNGADVIARSVLARPAGAFAFSAPSAVAAWVQGQAGVTPTTEFIAQADWNVDPRPELNPAFGNVFCVQLQYLGFGGIVCSIEDPFTARLLPVHVFRYSNQATRPSFGNPTFRIGWVTFNQGNTSNIRVLGPSIAGSVEGKVEPTERSRAAGHTTLGAVGTAEVNVLTLRSRDVMGNRRNRVETALLFLTASTESNKDVFLRVRAGADVAGDRLFEYVDKKDSVIEVDREAGDVTNGRLLATFLLLAAGTVTAPIKEAGLLLLAGETITISAEATGNPGGVVSASIIWREDL